MKKKRDYLFLAAIFFIFLTGCSMHSQETYRTTTNTQYVALLADPAVRKDFRALKAVVRNAHIYEKDGRPYLASADIKKMDAISEALINRLHYQYHLDPYAHKIHTYIGRNQYNSCYQYYNTMDPTSIGKSSAEFSNGFSSTELCNEYIKKLHSRPSLSIIHAHWWANEETTALVDTFRLRNGDNVYLGFELSSTDSIFTLKS